MVLATLQVVLEWLVMIRNIWNGWHILIEANDTYTRVLGRWIIFYYGMGHILNNIAPTCGFTYLLFFLIDIFFHVSIGLTNFCVIACW